MEKEIHQHEHQLPVPQRNEFKMLFSYISNLWKKGRVSTNLWSYWFVSVVLFGGVGVWTSIVLVCCEWKISSVLLALITLSPPIVAAACLDFIFISDQERYLTGPAILVGCVVGVIVLTAVLLKNLACLAYGFAILSVVIAYVIAWLSCARNPKFAEHGNYSAPVGGDATKKVGGSAEGFNI